jgi:serine/threonine protein kinase
LCSPHRLGLGSTSLMRFPNQRLNLVMDNMEGGMLWGVLESNPLEQIHQVDLRWWLPQVIRAVVWCHSQGFIHRHLPSFTPFSAEAHKAYYLQRCEIAQFRTQSCRACPAFQLINFGSAAPLVPGSHLDSTVTAVPLVAHGITFLPKTFKRMKQPSLPLRCLTRRLVRSKTQGKAVMGLKLTGGAPAP